MNKIAATLTHTVDDGTARFISLRDGSGYNLPRRCHDACSKFPSAHLHRDVGHNNVVQHTHPSGCHFHIRISLLEQVGWVKLGDQGLARVVDKKLLF